MQDINNPWPPAPPPSPPKPGRTILAIIPVISGDWWSWVLADSLRLRDCYRMQIIAWQFEASGMIRPRTANPSSDMNAQFFAIEQPDGQVYTYDANGVSCAQYKGINDLLERTALLNTPTEALASA